MSSNKLVDNPALRQQPLPIKDAEPAKQLPLRATTPKYLSRWQSLELKAQRKSSNKRAPQWEIKMKERDKKIMPSMASGGVPEPTAEYLQVAQQPSQKLDIPQHLLLVIDLNGTLLFRPRRDRPTHFIERANARLFLKYCLETFNVVIWSSARDVNVTAMCKTLMTSKQLQKCLAIWGRTKFNLSANDSSKRVVCFKRLSTVWNDPEIAKSHPDYHLGSRWDQTNTVLIDDSIDKARSEPFNLVEVPEWEGEPRDLVMPFVHDYINYLAQHSNVSAASTARPFKEVLQVMLASDRQ